MRIRFYKVSLTRFFSIRLGVMPLQKLSHCFGSSWIVGIQSDIFLALSDSSSTPANQSACKYVWHMVVCGRPTGLGYMCQAVKNLRGKYFSSIHAILPIQRNCQLTIIFSNGSIPKCLYISLLVIRYS